MLLRVVVLVAFVVLCGAARAPSAHARRRVRSSAPSSTSSASSRCIPSRGLIYGPQRRARCRERARASPPPSSPPTSRAIARWRSPAASSACSACPALETTLKIEAARKSNDPFTPIIVKDGLDQARSVPRARAAGAHARRAGRSSRRCATTPAATCSRRILGYTGRVDEEEYAELRGRRLHLASDRIGKAGVEAAYEALPARHRRARKQIEKDAIGPRDPHARRGPAVARQRPRAVDRPRSADARRPS